MKENDNLETDFHDLVCMSSLATSVAQRVTRCEDGVGFELSEEDTNLLHFCVFEVERRVEALQKRYLA